MVLVDGRVKLRGEQRAMRWCPACLDRAYRENARQLHFEFDVASLIEVPEETVIIIANRREGGDNQAPRAADLGVAKAPVRMFPQRAVIFLVQADGVLDRDR